jgi:hypothetical protein
MYRSIRLFVEYPKQKIPAVYRLQRACCLPPSMASTLALPAGFDRSLFRRVMVSTETGPRYTLERLPENSQLSPVQVIEKQDPIHRALEQQLEDEALRGYMEDQGMAQKDVTATPSAPFEKSTDDKPHIPSGRADTPLATKYEQEWVDLPSIQELETDEEIREQVARDEALERQRRAIAAMPPKPRNYEAIPRFNHLCQVHGLTSMFTFKEVDLSLFSSKVEFGHYVYEEAGPFSSKKLAKEAIAERALDALESLELPPKDAATKPSNVKSSDHDDESTTSSSSSAAVHRVPDEDCISILNLFAQKRHIAQPDFQFTTHNKRQQQVLGQSDTPVEFSCTLCIQARPNYLFGSENTTLHSSKAEAKRLVAKDAVVWLRMMGSIPEAAATPSPALKTRQSSEESSHMFSTQPSCPVDIEHSPAQRVVALSLRLGLSQPQYEYEPTGRNFYMCSARYLEKDVRREPRLEGALCMTIAIFGQKNARQECAGVLVDMLEALVAEQSEV